MADVRSFRFVCTKVKMRCAHACVFVCVLLQSDHKIGNERLMRVQFVLSSAHHRYRNATAHATQIANRNRNALKLGKLN